MRLLRKKLIEYSFKTITIDEMMKMCENCDYLSFVHKIDILLNDGLVEPVKAAGKNGRNPCVYNKYRIIKSDKNNKKVIEDIKRLHPIFNHSGYNKNPQLYLKHKKGIDTLSDFLWRKKDSLKDKLSINERSFQIWGKEKYIKNKRKSLESMLRFNDIDISYLNFFETPEPFFDYNFTNEKNMNVLIVENKDTWFSIRKIMREYRINNLVRPYHVLLYGEGKKIIRKSSRLLEYDAMLGGENHYYYFGDLDYEGIDIYQNLVKNNKNIKINLCSKLYTWMLKLSEEYELQKSKRGQTKCDISAFIDNFNNNDERDKIYSILNSGKYIPQEILGYKYLKDKMKEG